MHIHYNPHIHGHTHVIYCVLSLTLRTKNFMCPLFKHLPSKFYGQDLYFPQDFPALTTLLLPAHQQKLF